MGKSFSRPYDTLRRSPDTRANSAPISCSPNCFLQEPAFHDRLCGTLSSAGTTTSKPHHISRSLRNSLLCVTQRFCRQLNHDADKGTPPLSHDLSSGGSFDRLHPCSHSTMARDHSLRATQTRTSDPPVQYEKSADHSASVVMASPNSFVFGSKRNTITDSTPGSNTSSASSTRLWTSPPSPPQILPTPIHPTVSPTQPLPYPSPLLWQVQLPNYSPYSSSGLDPYNRSSQDHPKTSTLGTHVTQQSSFPSAVRGVARISFVRPHERNLPYGRRLATSFFESTHRNTQASSLEESSMRSNISSVCHTVDAHEGDLRSISTQSSNTLFAPLQPDFETPVSGKPLSLNPVTAFGDVPNSPRQLHSSTSYTRRFRQPFSASTVSLTSADLMLDTDPSLVYTPTENKPSPHEMFDSKEKSFASSFKDHITSTILESVAELSHDNLTRGNTPNETTSDTSKVQSPAYPFYSISRTPFDELRSTRCVYPASTSCSRNPCPDCLSVNPENFQNTSAIGGSLSQRRRLRSMPGRARAGSLSLSSYATVLFNEGDDSAVTSLGERATVLCATDQRHILQDLNRVKLLLLKLRRLLTEDQWHLPVFTKQLSMTEPIRKPRLRIPLPTEWLDLQSTDSPYDSFSQHQLSELHPVDSGHISDETVSPKHYDLVYQSSVADEKRTATPSPDSSLAEPDVASRLAEVRTVSCTFVTLG
ncbi:unnamed protein product [Dicrocoelium dendriticum]|nr:unnamed protein product [Dicrocoelium dendriticum]CAH8464145.1 unnamed protein product [Dicrocoelium dendriticum]